MDRILSQNPISISNTVDCVPLSRRTYFDKFRYMFGKKEKCITDLHNLPFQMKEILKIENLVFFFCNTWKQKIDGKIEK
jgi:hypothetical protein